MHSTITRSFLILAVLALPTSAALAAIVDGDLSDLDEYRFNTEAPPNSKWNTRVYGNTAGERNDGSGGDDWDINYLGTDVKDGKFHVGITGGSILSGQNDYRGTQLELGDIAINVVLAGETVSDPAASSAGWDYALRLMSIDETTGNALFSLFALVSPVPGNGDPGLWMGSGKGTASPTYMHEDHSYGSTQTFRLENGFQLADDIEGKYNQNTEDNGVLEASFDLGLLSLFDEAKGGDVIAYLTMSCANDEAIVEAHIPAVPLPAAFWLFGSALIGFIGFSRRTRV